MKMTLPKPSAFFVLSLLCLFPASCTDPGVASDAAVQADAASADATSGLDAGRTNDAGWNPDFHATESNEHDLPGYGWIAAGQPSQPRLTTVVGQGARIISLRYQSEESFDEQALVEGAGGTFIRYAVQGSAYNDSTFREALYDLYDAQIALGGNVYMHCASSNRAGASWALYQAERKGVAAEAAVQMGIDAGMSSLESMVRGILGI